MRNWLLLWLAAVTATIFAAPAHAQYIFLDVDGDQQCTSQDFPPFQTGHVSVWLDTAHNADGEPAVCATGQDLSIGSYELVFGTADISIDAWANFRTEFQQLVGIASEGGYFYIGFSSGGATYLPPGLYKLGELFTSASDGCSVIQILANAVVLDETRTTGVGTQCLGTDGDYMERLGVEFTDKCGINRICDDVDNTTWGKIKKLYLEK